MIIATVSHESSRGAKDLLGKIESTLENTAKIGEEQPAVIFGPDYGLIVDETFSPLSSAQRQAVLKQIKGISKRFPQTRIIPGTMPWIEGQIMYHSAPMYHSGRLEREFFKETDNGESKLAAKYGLTFRKGRSEENNFFIEDRKICYEICGDHGKQNVTGCFAELIAALDQNKGFYVSILNDAWRHYGLLTNGLDGVTRAQDYSPAELQKLKELPFRTDKETKYFNLKTQ